jgi:hypothetical protein
MTDRGGPPRSRAVAQADPERVDDLRSCRITTAWLDGRCHVPEDARRRRVEVEHFGSEVLEPSFGKQGRQLVGGRRRSGRGGTGATRLGYQSDATAGPQQPAEFA